MSHLLIDTGPLVALIDRRDRHHVWTREFFETVKPPVSTCEPVLTEACFLLRAIGADDAVLELMEKGILTVPFRVLPELKWIRMLMRKFADAPMSLADACLVRMTELNERSVIVTFDSDFSVYRRNRRQVVPTIMPE